MSGYQAEIEAFMQAIADDTEPDASGTDGLRVAEITEAIQRSQREGRAMKTQLGASAAH